MISFATAEVKKIIKEQDGLTELEVLIDGAVSRAVNIDALTGRVAQGDRLVVNVTAVELGLGTGGRHFVLWNLARGAFKETGPGHLMKLKYTPLQLASLSIEEQKSPHHETLRDAVSVDGLPIIACGLHSQVLPIAATLKAVNPDIRIAYVMTDGGALAAPFSQTVRWLKDERFIEAVISAGQAFGGDFESVNIYSAIVAAAKVIRADVVVVAMGPGIAGTGTALGHSGIEQGQIINAVKALGGIPVAALRLSQADDRERHQGISHHTITALTTVALAPAMVAVPEMSGDLAEFGKQIDHQLEESGISGNHQVKSVDNQVTIEQLKKIEGAGGPRASTMGRGVDEEPAFFLAAGAAAITAGELVR